VLQPVPDSDLALMRRIDELHLNHPFAGTRLLHDLLCLNGLQVNRRQVSTLMKVGIDALYRRPNASSGLPLSPAGACDDQSQPSCGAWKSPV
jgi:putative transposase